MDWFGLETKRFGMFPPIPCTFAELDLDTELNRRLLSAGHVLLRTSDVARSILGRVLQHFVGVTNVAYPRTRLPPLTLDRRTERFRASLTLAEAVLRHLTLNLTTGEVQATGFLIDMNVVFEEFAMKALGNRLGTRWTFVRAPVGLTLDEGEQVSITPDGQLLDASIGTVCVLDAKYKVAESARSNDVYQMLAYCTGLGSRLGVLVYADARDHRYVIRESGIAIHVFGVRLDRPATELEARMDEIASHVAALVSVPPPSVATAP
jgi:5-methylcytosine-specific restriction enzyme subunit McrC